MKFNERFQLLIWPWPGGGGARSWPSGTWDEESGADLDRGWTRTWGAGPSPTFFAPAPLAGVGFPGAQVQCLVKVTFKTPSKTASPFPQKLKTPCFS